MLHADQRWVPLEAYEHVLAERNQLEAEVAGLMSTSAAEMVDSAQAIAFDAQARNLRLFERIAKLEAAGDALALIHLAPCTMKQAEADVAQWTKAKKDAQ
jgi:hypothetical protein